MKKIHLLSSFLALTPVSLLIPVLASCGNSQSGYNISIDPAVDQSKISITSAEVILNKELTIEYKITDPNYVLDETFSTLTIGSDCFKITDFDLSQNNKIIVSADKVTSSSVVANLLLQDIEYQKSWTYVENGQSHQFVPSTQEKDLPEGTKTFDEYQKLYFDAIKSNNQLFSDDIFWWQNHVQEIIPAVGNFYRVYVNTNTIGSTDFHLSFDIKMELNLTKDIVSEGSVVMKAQRATSAFSFVNVPFAFAQSGIFSSKYLMAKAITDEDIESLRLDHNWSFKFQTKQEFKTGEVAETKGSYNYNLPTEPTKLQEFQKCICSYYLNSYYMSHVEISK